MLKYEHPLNLYWPDFISLHITAYKNGELYVINNNKKYLRKFTTYVSLCPMTTASL